MNRRQLIAGFAATALAASVPVVAASSGSASSYEVLVAQLRAKADRIRTMLSGAADAYRILYRLAQTFGSDFEDVVQRYSEGTLTEKSLADNRGSELGMHIRRIHNSVVAFFVDHPRAVL